MKALKELIESVEKQTRIIEGEIKLVNQAETDGGYKICASGGYCSNTFTGERALKIRALIESFIKEDDEAREPLKNKLNLISDLVEGK